MLLDSIINILYSLLSFILENLPTLPAIPSSITDVVTSFLNTLFGYMGLLGIFFNLSILKVIFYLVLAVLWVEFEIKLVVFVIKKIPLAGMS